MNCDDFRFVAVPVCGRFGLWPFRFVAVPVCGRSGLWPFRFVAVPVCGRSGLWPFRFVAVSVCGRFGCGRFGLWPLWPVTDLPYTTTLLHMVRDLRQTVGSSYLNINENTLKLSVVYRIYCDKETLSSIVSKLKYIMELWVKWYCADTDVDIRKLSESPYIDFHSIANHLQTLIEYKYS